MKKTTGYIAGFSILAILIGVVYYVQISWRSFFSVALANPDYICVKPISVPECEVTKDSWDPTLWQMTTSGYVRIMTTSAWGYGRGAVDNSTSSENWSGWDKSTHSITLPGRYRTAVYYVNKRTSCEPGYTNFGTTGTNWGGDSGREGMSDQTYSYGGTCTIVKTDNAPPVSNPVVSSER